MSMATAPKAAAAADPQATTTDVRRMLMLLVADWLNNDRTHAGEIAAIYADIIAQLGPPTNRDVPYVGQTGDTLNCTMGNWDGEPTEYAYAWHSDGVANGATGAEHAIAPEDAGHTLACVVTATNALGSTAAPMSNGVAIPGQHDAIAIA
jgi:hypothetical protein